MGIVKIKYENIKSIKDGYLTLTELNILLGRNGSGKTNLQKHLSYFYDNLTTKSIRNDIFDKQNPYNDYAKISIKYDLSDIIKEENLEQEMFKEILNELDCFKTITITFTQYKDNKVTWSHSYGIRKLIKYLFPIYFIDVRDIDLLDWENIWDLIGDLGQKRSRQEENFLNELDTLLHKTYGKKYIENLSQLKNEIKAFGYGVVPYNNSEKFKQLYKLIFGGEIFNYKENSLNFYSNGSNSFNYIRIFYLVLNMLHLDKFKHPLVILDEPEIGLHPTLIDELIKFISMSEGKVQTLLSTHSSRVIKNSIILSKVNIYQVLEIKNRTLLKKVKAFDDIKLKRVISDKEASYYFANGILFVEGITEYELFTNTYLTKVYPILNNVEIFSYDSNNTALNVSHPHQRKMNIPYLLLLDLDKILQYEFDTKKFKIVGDWYNPLKNKEIYREEMFYYGKWKDLRILRNRIKGIVGKIEFNVDENYYTINHQLFDDLRTFVKKYCNSYYVYPVETTIEGVLINRDNYTYFFEWLTSEASIYENKIELHDVLKLSDDINYQVNVLRILVKGKVDILITLKTDHLSSTQKTNINQGYTLALGLAKMKKGSGWVSEFIEYIYITLKNNNEIHKFNTLFPELSDIIKKLELVME